MLNEKRHKCSACGKVRYESFMFKLTREFLGYGGRGAITTRYGHELWFCESTFNSSFCKDKAKKHNIY